MIKSLNTGFYSNQIGVIEGLSTLTSLTTLILIENRITYVPNILVYCPRLQYLGTDDNPIEIFHPVIEEFIRNQMRRRAESTTRLVVYSDTQSVHSVNIQSCIRKNIVTLLETDRLTPFREISGVTESLLADEKLKEETKKALVEHSSDSVNEIISLPGVRFADVLLPVWNRVTNLQSPVANEVKRVLNTEITDAECMCFTGRVSRLVNCLTGFFPDITVEISKSEQIANIIYLSRRKLLGSTGYNREDHVRLVAEQMTERGYMPEEIEVWTAAIE